jgi:hypothetical protein
MQSLRFRRQYKKLTQERHRHWRSRRSQTRSLHQFRFPLRWYRSTFGTRRNMCHLGWPPSSARGRMQFHLVLALERRTPRSETEESAMKTLGNQKLDSGGISLAIFTRNFIVNDELLFERSVRRSSVDMQTPTTSFSLCFAIFYSAIENASGLIT